MCGFDVQTYDWLGAEGLEAKLGVYLVNDCVPITVFSNHIVFATEVASYLACNTEKDKQNPIEFQNCRLDRDVHTTDLLIPIAHCASLKLIVLW